MSARARFILAITALCLSGCALIRHLPVPAPMTPCRECVNLPTTAEVTTCLLACTAPRATPTLTSPSATATSEATSTAAPVSSPTPTPTSAPRWVTTIRLVNGFGNCSPHPCNPLDTTTIIRDGKTCVQLGYAGRTRCDGDRTYLYTMPDFDLVPKGEGCWELWGHNPDASLYNRCMNNDSPGTPCNGAAACDRDHLDCPRTAYGCNGRELGDPRGSILNVTGGVTCIEHDNHYGMTCRGEPGAHYMICARPFPDAHDEQGNPLPIKGTGENCKSGWF